MRSTPCAIALAACIFAQVACTADNTPCANDCPPLQGEWAVSFADGGTPDADCDALGVTLAPGVLAITQADADLEATFEGLALSGLAYDTQTFTLQSRSDGGTDVTSVRGDYVRTGAPDAGTGRLSGTWTRTARDTPATGAARTCTLLTPFTAERQ